MTTSNPIKQPPRPPTALRPGYVRIVLRPYLARVIGEVSCDDPSPLLLVRSADSGLEAVLAGILRHTVDVPESNWAEHDAPVWQRLYSRYRLLCFLHSYNTFGGSIEQRVWEDFANQMSTILYAQFSPPPPTPKTKDNMGWGEAFEAACALLQVRRRAWPADEWVAWQTPTKDSKMGSPYLYRQTIYTDSFPPNLAVCAPWTPTNEDMWARDWELYDPAKKE